MKNKADNKTTSLFEDNFDEDVEASHEFGGIWTKEKLSKLEQYLQQFTTVFKHLSWAKTIYIDAYAGTGRCDIKTDKGIVSIAGSAKLALDTQPIFNEIVLIEQDKSRFEQLENLKTSFPDANLDIYQGDCNELLPKLLKDKISSTHRGVIFVDPYGMNISWSLLEQIAATKKLDVWYLFPLSGLYRQAAVDLNDVTEDKRAAIERLLGDCDWENELYKKEPNNDLFGNSSKLYRTQDMDEIVDFVSKRLGTIFPYISKPLLLPMTGTRRFAFYFAISNDSSKAQSIAKRISHHILKPVIG